MIYLVSQNKSLFGSSKYREVSFKEAMKVLYPLALVQFDTETEGLDPHTKKLLTVQLGNKENQVVFDWQTLTNEEKLELKKYFESDRVFLGWNLLFDLGFMYVQDIWVKHILDGMIIEKLLWLGYDHKDREMSLKAAAMNYLGYDLDKSVRGQIINVGLTENVVVYAAGDVMWLEDIKNKQDIEVAKQHLEKAVEIECEFIKGLAYFKHCGVHLNERLWRNKMSKDLLKLKEAEQALNDWVVNWDNDREETVEIVYPTMNASSQEEILAILKEISKKNSPYIRYPKEDLDSPEGSVPAYKKINKFTKVEKQGDLFSGFDSKPKCTINWSSSDQVIKLFEILGIDVTTFDKKTKKKKKSINKNIIKPQASKFPIIPIYLKYQEASKLVSTYGENWLRARNPKTGRIHVDFHSIGTDTARVSSGGGVYKLNLQNLPHDAETRACFEAEEGNAWISADYQSQESRIIASVSKDEAMMDLFEHGCGDVHSLVAKMSYPEIIGECPVEEIKAKFHNYRQEAKGIEFSINYGGDANTIANNKGIPITEAEQIYNNFMKGFPGVKRYQDYCRMAVMRDGYILMNPLTGHRCHIPDWDNLARIKSKFNDSDFWAYYREMKEIAPSCETVQNVKLFRRRQSELEKDSINYRIQNRGALCFKLSSIMLFNWIVEHNYQNIVKMCVPVHDEFNLECPKEMAKEVADVLIKCMVKGGKPFCPNVFLGADVDINTHWVH